MKQGLADKIRQAIRESIVQVLFVRAVSMKRAGEQPTAILDELTRNVAQSVVNLLDTVEGEESCPACGRCVICGKDGEHEH